MAPRDLAHSIHSILQVQSDFEGKDVSSAIEHYQEESVVKASEKIEGKTRRFEIWIREVVPLNETELTE